MVSKFCRASKRMDLGMHVQPQEASLADAQISAFSQLIRAGTTAWLRLEDMRCDDALPCEHILQKRQYCSSKYQGPQRWIKWVDVHLEFPNSKSQV